MKNYKILGQKYGVTITKPWSKEMYEHNDTVADFMKENIFTALTSAYNQCNSNLQIQDAGYNAADEELDSIRRFLKLSNEDFGDWDWDGKELFILEHEAENKLRHVAKALCGYEFGSSYSIDDIYSEACKELDNVQNYWLNEIYQDLVKLDYVRQLDVLMVGYEK
jgi:hypothetical protein